jgi:hypothetical protein
VFIGDDFAVVSIAKKIDNYGLKKYLWEPTQCSRNKDSAGYIVVIEGVVHIPVDHVQDSLNPQAPSPCIFQKLMVDLLIMMPPALT